MGDLDRLEDYEGFVPDVIIVDYFDILAPEDEREIGRDRIDSVWKKGKQIADIRNILLVTASQANRLSIEKKNVKQVHASEDLRKLAHVDCMFSINQMPAEKKRGIMRIGIMAHRHKDFNELESTIILQNLEVGQPLLDSEYGVIDTEDKKGE
jgi:replicative DNA helicase